jgi:hypothetical protein
MSEREFFEILNETLFLILLIWAGGMTGALYGLEKDKEKNT